MTELPAGLNHHWTKNLLASRDGRKLYATVGSNSNVAEHGLAAEEGRAAIWEIDVASGAKRLFATGLRNPNGLAWEPSTGVLWTVVNERDELGSDLVPDYLTSVREGGFYGWPWSYWGAHVDARVQPPRPDLVARAIVPDYALGNHVAPLGLAFSDGRAAGAVRAAAPSSACTAPGTGARWPATRWCSCPSPAAARPGRRWTSSPAFSARMARPGAGRSGWRSIAGGALLVADDVGNAVWRVAPAR